MTERAARLDPTAVAALLLCCALWGLNQVAIKAALPEVSSLVQLSVRSAVAAALLLAWMRWRGIGWSLRAEIAGRTLAPGLLAGLLFVVEFGLIFVGLQHTTAARSVVFINTSPFVVALVLAALVPAERIRAAQWVGLTIAFGSVAVGFWGPGGGATLIGDAMVLGAAVLWGLTTVTIRLSALRHAPAERTLAYQLVVAAVLAPLAAWLAGERLPTHWSALAIASVAYQAVVVTFASYLLWFWLLTRYAATRVQAFVFLTPVFGTGFAAVLLDEPVGATLLVALAGIALGLWLANRPPAARRAEPAAG